VTTSGAVLILLVYGLLLPLPLLALLATLAQQRRLAQSRARWTHMKRIAGGYGRRR